MRRAVITGANGQDGILLSRWLLRLGYRVFGLVRGPDRQVAEGVEKRIDPAPSRETFAALFAEVRPDEIYHLAGDTFAGYPREGPTAMIRSNVVQTSELLDAAVEIAPDVRIFLAGSAAVFGNPPVSPQSEKCPKAPTSLYGATKLTVHSLADYHRGKGRFVSAGILYNHESTLRPPQFVTRKITSAVAAIAAGRQRELVLGNLNVIRDWGHAEDFVKAMHLILQAPKPEDWIVATGKGHTVREFCRFAFEAAGLDYERYVVSSPDFWRPAEEVPLVGDPGKLEDRLGWRREHDFASLVREMTGFDMSLEARRGASE